MKTTTIGSSKLAHICLNKTKQPFCNVPAYRAEPASDDSAPCPMCYRIANSLMKGTAQ